MLRKLHTRLVLSHTLPIIVLAPALILVLFYLLNSQQTLGALADQLNGQGNLIIQIAEANPKTWIDTDVANEVIEQVKSGVPSRIMILTKDKRLVASSLDSDLSRIGELLNFSVVREAATGQTNWLIEYSPFMKSRILDMAIPARNPKGEVNGIVRLSYDITGIEQRTLPLSVILAITFIIGFLLTLLFSIGLARSLSAPLLLLTRSVSNLSPGYKVQDLPETGPDELRIVAHNYNQMIHRLDENEKTRQQLIANLVHELGTPLGAIKAASEALRNGAILNQNLAAELAIGINSQVDQMRLLIEDLALLGESELKPIVLHREWCSLEELIQTQCHMYAYLAKTKNIHLSYDMRDEIPPIFVDRQRIRQVLANLLHNAYKYSPPNSHITVSASIQTTPSPEILLIKVVDTGTGIAPEEQLKIFDLLYRSPGQRNMHKGMGIGLALSKRLVETHGGRIDVASEVGQGTTFRISLPLDNIAGDLMP